MRFKKNTFYPRRIKSGGNSFSPYSKYRAQKTEVDGITFASKAEAALYCLLKTKSDKIYCQPKVYLTDAKILYKPDFFVDDIYYEMKGIETASWRLKRRLWQFYGPGVLHVYKMRGKEPDLFEVISVMAKGNPAPEKA